MLIRSNRLRATPSKWLVCALALPVMAGMGGCREYFDRQETITLGVGNSIEVNKATQTIERWPRTAQHDRWQSDGERARLAIERYRTRTIGVDSETKGETSESATTSK